MQDKTLRQNIIDELEFEPSIDAADIGVAVENGVVTLTGHVPAYTQKTTIEATVRRIRGVRGIAEEIEVRPRGSHVTADDVVAQRAVNALKWHEIVPDEKLQVTVSKGWLTLTGAVEWQYQRDAAMHAIKGLAGITGISNLIEVVPKVSAPDVKKRIEDAFKRDAEIEADAIKVHVQDGKVTLEGKVKAYRERQAAERAAWSAAGVRHVDDRITVL
ncbi:BON domain-containing protein [Martelella mediterranea]|uniref:Periplasmic protein n=1 Tax=Martelella mediterranea DSM 17316 TaxID=1122214 RepID=A0A1U9Z0G2_9HYPH|nr:BON domain-containing protein [Martelella mediterranea]AQZ51130.1 periplasmic protein [Martelella mediterranea DSM 17316]